MRPFPARNEELVLLVYMVLWLQLIGIRVSLMDLVYKYAQVNVFQWYRTENDVPAVDMVNATSYGNGSDGKDNRLN